MKRLMNSKKRMDVPQQNTQLNNTAPSENTIKPTTNIPIPNKANIPTKPGPKIPPSGNNTLQSKFNPGQVVNKTISKGMPSRRILDIAKNLENKILNEKPSEPINEESNITTKTEEEKETKVRFKTEGDEQNDNKIQESIETTKESNTQGDNLIMEKKTIKMGKKGTKMKVNIEV